MQMPPKKGPNTIFFDGLKDFNERPFGSISGLCFKSVVYHAKALFSRESTMREKLIAPMNIVVGGVACIAFGLVAATMEARTFWPAAWGKTKNLFNNLGKIFTKKPKNQVGPGWLRNSSADVAANKAQEVADIAAGVSQSAAAEIERGRGKAGQAPGQTQVDASERGVNRRAHAARERSGSTASQRSRSGSWSQRDKAAKAAAKEAAVKSGEVKKD